MPNVRHTPKRRRRTCPICRRDVSFTHPWMTNWRGTLVRDTDLLVFKAHNNPAGRPCDVNGPNGFGYRIPSEHDLNEAYGV